MIWDVHEDTVAALGTKPGLPRPLRPPAAVAVRTAERMAERYVHLILAEYGYVKRFARPHPVVPNTTYVPDAPAPPGDGRRVVYVGHGVLDRRRPGRRPVLAWSPRAGSMLPWATAVVLLLFPIAVADFDYRYLLPVLPFASLAAGRRSPPPAA